MVLSKILPGLSRARIIFYGLMIFSSIGCSPQNLEETVSMPRKIEIHANQSAKELLKLGGDQVKVINRPPGVNFYSIDWPRSSLGTVQIRSGAHVVEIPSVLGVAGSDDPNFAEENIINWQIYAGISDQELMNHDEARQRFFAILQSLRNAGWVRAVRVSEPRLKGREALHYLQTRALVYSLDPDYVLSLKEWMSLEDRTTWSFYCDHAYLDISITRDPSRNDLAKPGAYFVEYSLRSENERWRAVVGPAKRVNWKAELPAALSAQQRLRALAEDELKKNHIPIDEAYRDPPVPRLGP